MLDMDVPATSVNASLHNIWQSPCCLLSICCLSSSLPCAVFASLHSDSVQLGVISSEVRWRGAVFPAVLGQMSQEPAADQSRCLHLCGAGEGGCRAAGLFVDLLQRIFSFQAWEQVVCLLFKLERAVGQSTGCLVFFSWETKRV